MNEIEVYEVNNDGSSQVFVQTLDMVVNEFIGIRIYVSLLLTKYHPILCTQTLQTSCQALMQNSIFVGSYIFPDLLPPGINIMNSHDLMHKKEEENKTRKRKIPKLLNQKLQGHEENV